MEIRFKGYVFDTGLVIVFISAFVLLVWIVLKLFRIVQTPLFFELLPVMTGLAAIFGFGMAIGKQLQMMKQLQENDKDLSRRMEDLASGHTLLKAEFNHFARYGRKVA
jgi:hypothetical protein